VRTLTFIAQRPDWLVDPAHWQGVTRQVEDKVSDALHERLTQRFVDRRTSVLMRRLRENAMLEAEISATGDVSVEGHVIGHLQGFQFVPDPQADGTEAKALRAAASKALAQEFDNRSQRVINGVDDAFALAQDGALRWLGEVVARITSGDRILDPHIRLLADEQLAGAAREGVEARLQAWLKAHITKLLGPFQVLESADSLTGIARGIAYQLSESLGVLDRSKVAEDVKGLEQTDRAALRALGVRFGAFHLTVPALLKPAPRALAAQLWALHHPDLDQAKLGEILHLSYSGRTSIPAEAALGPDLYRMAGFKLCGQRAVRVDILERLADLIRPAIQYRPGLTAGEPPAGAADGDGFVVTTAMTSLCGCAGEDFSEILRALGYAMTKRKGPAITKAIVPLAPVTEVVPVAPIEPDRASVSADPTDSGVSAPEQTEQTQETPDTNPVETTLAADPVAPVAEPEPQSVAVSETSEATSDEAGSVTEPAEAVEEPEIEVWRLYRAQRPRPHHGQNRHKSRHKEHAATGEAGSVAAEKDGAAPRRERGPFKDRSQRGEGDKSEAGDGRSFRPKGGRPDHQKGRDGKPQGERGSQDRSGQDRGGKGPRHAGRERPLSNWQDQPRQKSNKEPDPNSPFAKLLALKAQMQGGSSDTDKG
jgi:ATP-dependent RNA helicase SUPV3L1/SUV3